MAVGDRLEKFRTLVNEARRDLFNQHDPFGRLALVQTLMLAGDTLVAISLAGTLFFSISTHAAKGKVLLYLVLTLAPFAIVSPLLGPLIDRTKGARRAMCVFSALGRAALCPFLAANTHQLLLFPLAFLVFVLSKLYLVTRGALVPEMMAMKQGTEETDPESVEGAAPGKAQFAALNARLTLLGTLAGFVAAIPGGILYKTVGSPGVLIFDAFVFVAAAVASARLPAQGEKRGRTRRAEPRRQVVDQANADLASLQALAHPEVLTGLTTMSVVRGLAGFLTFFLAFGLRNHNTALYWYGLALGGSGVGAIVGLLVVAELRRFLNEQTILLIGIWSIGVGGLLAAFWNALLGQVFLAFVVGVAGSISQPSFDALTQRLVPVASQGRAFARFAMRQQLVWVLGALIPVVVNLPFAAGDVVMATVAGVGGLFYVTSRQALRGRALPKAHRRLADEER